MPHSSSDHALVYTTHLFIKLVRECGRLGVSARALLHGTGVTEQRLQDSEERVSLRQTLQLVDNALRLTGRPDLGLLVGEKTHLNDGGMAAVAATASRDFWQKAHLHERYHKLSGQLLVPQWLEEHGCQVYRLHVPSAMTNQLTFFVEEGFAALLSSMQQNYGLRVVPREIRFAYAPPVHQARYAEYFGCPVQFDAVHNELVCNFMALSTAHRIAHPLNFSLCERLCAELDRQGGIVEQVKALLQQQGDAISMEDIAARMAMTSRTLSRHLARESQSFQALKDEVRLEKSMQLLKHTGLPIEAIADATGFRSTRRFRDFFSRQQGITPSAFRKGSDPQTVTIP